MPRIFGTDGVRGLANDKLTAELAVDLGSAAARVLVEHGGYSRPRPLAVVGRDTRISGQFLEHAVVAGDRKSTRLNSSHVSESRMPSSA